MTRFEEEDPQSRVLHEISSMITQILRSPSTTALPFPALSRRSTTSYSLAMLQSSPASFALLFLGISIAMMMFGSIIFLIGFILMPWIVGLVLIFYFAGFLFNLSHLGRSFLCSAPHSQDVPAWRYS